MSNLIKSAATALLFTGFTTVAASQKNAKTPEKKMVDSGTQLSIWCARHGDDASAKKIIFTTQWRDMSKSAPEIQVLEKDKLTILPWKDEATLINSEKDTPTVMSTLEPALMNPIDQIIVEAEKICQEKIDKNDWVTITVDKSSNARIQGVNITKAQKDLYGQVIKTIKNDIPKAQ